jgi:hypothetical protein
MFCMSEEEKREQIGALVEEYSHLKGKLAHVNEKLSRCQQSYVYVGQNFQNVRVANGQLAIQPGRPGVASVHGLLDNAQLAEAITERDHLNEEVRQLQERLKPLAPHLF